MIIHILAAIGALSVTSWLMLAAWIWACHRADKRRNARREVEIFAALCDAIERHPAGKAQFAFRARPCGHLLFSPTLDVIDMEHREFDHVLTCRVAEDLIANRKDEAA